MKHGTDGHGCVEGECIEREELNVSVDKGRCKWGIGQGMRVRVSVGWM